MEGNMSVQKNNYSQGTCIAPEYVFRNDYNNNYHCEEVEQYAQYKIRDDVQHDLTEEELSEIFERCRRNNPSDKIIFCSCQKKNLAVGVREYIFDDKSIVYSQQFSCHSRNLKRCFWKGKNIEYTVWEHKGVHYIEFKNCCDDIELCKQFLIQGYRFGGEFIFIDRSKQIAHYIKMTYKDDTSHKGKSNATLEVLSPDSKGAVVPLYECNYIASN